MIDWARMNELRAEIGPDDFRDVVAMFLDEADDAIARLQAARDPALLAHELHFLKGSAVNIGFATLAALCDDGERRAAAGRGDAVDLAAIIRTYHATRASFDAACPPSDLRATA